VFRRLTHLRVLVDDAIELRFQNRGWELSQVCLSVFVLSDEQGLRAIESHLFFLFSLQLTKVAD
jgi:hypothetical protein